MSMMQLNVGGSRKTTRRYAALAIAAMLAAAFGILGNLSTYRLLGSHELFVAEPARGMLRTGDWVVPRYGTLPHLEKPPLGYWVVAAASAPFGAVSEFTARLPAAISAIAVSVLLGFWAWKVRGPIAGLGAALMHATFVSTLQFGRKAEVDMLLCLLCTAAMYLIAEQPAEEPRGRSSVRWLAVYALLSLAWLAKFHYGPTMVLVPTLVYFAIDRRRSLRKIAHPVGLLLFALAVVVWPMLVLRQNPGAADIWYEQTIGRATGSKSNEPIWLYAPVLLTLSLPWSPVLAAALWSSKAAWSRRPGCEAADPEAAHRRAHDRFLWTWLVCDLAILTLQPSKHTNYLLAVMPALALLGAGTFASLVSRFGGRALDDRRALVVVVPIGLALAAPAVGFAFSSAALASPGLSILVLALFVGAALVMIGSLAAMRRFTPAAFVLAAGYCVAQLLVNRTLTPQLDVRSSFKEFGHQVRTSLAASEQVFFYRMGMHGLVYYVDGPIGRMESPDSLSELLDTHRRVVVLCHPWSVCELRSKAAVKLLAYFDPHNASPLHGVSASHELPPEALKMDAQYNHLGIIDAPICVCAIERRSNSIAAHRLANDP